MSFCFCKSLYPPPPLQVTSSSSSDGGSEEEASVVRGERKGAGANPLRSASCAFTKGKKEEKKEVCVLFSADNLSIL